MTERNKNFIQSALYHGTTHPFTVGDVVEPRSLKLDLSGTRVAYATTNKTLAQVYSEGRGAAARVFHVEPVDHKDVEYGTGTDSDVAMSRKGFKVVKEVTDDEK